MTKALLLLALMGATLNAQKREIRPEEFTTGTITKIERKSEWFYYTIRARRADYVAWSTEALHLTEGAKVRFAVYLGDDKHRLYIIDEDGKTQEVAFYIPGVAFTPEGTTLPSGIGNVQAGSHSLGRVTG